MPDVARETRDQSPKRLMGYYDIYQIPLFLAANGKRPVHLTYDFSLRQFRCGPVSFKCTVYTFGFVRDKRTPVIFLRPLLYVTVICSKASQRSPVCTMGGVTVLILHISLGTFSIDAINVQPLDASIIPNRLSTFGRRSGLLCRRSDGLELT